jgi:hypothetical protein
MRAGKHHKETATPEAVGALTNRQIWVMARWRLLYRPTVPPVKSAAGRQRWRHRQQASFVHNWM